MNGFIPCFRVTFFLPASLSSVYTVHTETGFTHKILIEIEQIFNIPRTYFIITEEMETQWTKPKGLPWLRTTTGKRTS